MLEVNGILLVDKPQEWTSHDVCAFVRKRFRIKKVGHAGTLDPLATGLLVLLLGKATKVSMALSSSDKEYYGKMELGIETDSHDRQGKVLNTAPWEHITEEDIRREAGHFRGDILQTPPMVSALKHQGVRLYQLARKGVSVPRQERKVYVQDLRIDEKEGPFIKFLACVSKGTYVRTLVHDLGEKLGCHAALAELRRLRSGEFHLDRALTIESLKELPREKLSEKIIPLRSPAVYANPHRP